MKRAIRLADVFFILCLLTILAYGASFALYILHHLDVFGVSVMYADDAFYYFQIAKNFADGYFSTFDNGITRTNGYHPLWMLLITPLWWIFDSENVLLAIKVFEIMLAAGAVVLIVIALRLACVYWLLLFGTLPVLYSNEDILFGLEASAGLFILGMLFLVLVLYARDSMRWRWLVAVVVFLLPWARLEYMAISLTTTVVLYFVERSRSDEGYSLMPLRAAGAGCFFYFIYNRIIFGGFVPISGPIKQLISQEQFEKFANMNGEYNFLQNFQDIANTVWFDQELLVAFEVCIYFLLIWGFCLRTRKREDWMFLAFLIGMFGLAAGHVAKFVHNVFTMHPDVVNISGWHYVPGFLLMALIVPVRCFVVIYFINRLVDWKHSRIVGVLRKASLILLHGSIFGFTAWFIFTNTDFLAPYRYVDQYSKIYSIARKPTRANSSYAGAMLMNRIFPKGSIVGSWDSGVMGYFSRFPVVNLDGLVNSYDYLKIRRDNSEIGIMYNQYDKPDFYIRLFGITHFANHLHIHNFHKSEKFLGNMYFEAHPFRYNSYAFVYWPSWLPRNSEIEIEPGNWFWERMRPHFDLEADGVGAVVDGRLVQIFTNECKTEKGESSLVILFDKEGGISGIANPWKNPWTMKRENAPGSCIDTIWLSRNAARPIRMEVLSTDRIISRLVGNARRIVRSDYDVYFHKHKLIYVNEQCDPDISPSFFINITPMDDSDLYISDRQKGFNEHHFVFGEHADRVRNICIAVYPLPEYEIARIRTGQSTGNSILWDVDFRFDTTITSTR